MIDRKLADELRGRAQKGDTAVLRSPEFKSLFDQIKTLPEDQRAAFGKEVNALREELSQLLNQGQAKTESLPPIDVTAPFDVNVPPDQRPKLLPSEQGSQ